MKKSIILALFIGILSSCTFFRPHKMDIEQGNIILQEDVSRLKIGMSESQVKKIMGNPLLVNAFTRHRLNYVYTIKHGYEPMQEKKVICLFEDGRLVQIIT